MFLIIKQTWKSMEDVEVNPSIYKTYQEADRRANALTEIYKISGSSLVKIPTSIHIKSLEKDVEWSKKNDQSLLQSALKKLKKAKSLLENC